MNKFEFSVL